MDGAARIATAIVVAALLSVFVFIGYAEFSRQRSIYQAQAEIQGFTQSMDDLAHQEQVRQARVVEQRRMAVVEDLRRRVLAGNQRCIGGVVVQIEGAAYTQVGTIAHPVHCSGAYADRPLR